MTDAHYFMVFGAAIATAGFILAVTAKSGQGQTTIKVFGAEMTLAAAGGVVVILLGVFTFATPTLVASFRPVSSPSANQGPPKPEGQKEVLVREVAVDPAPPPAAPEKPQEPVVPKYTLAEIAIVESEFQVDGVLPTDICKGALGRWSKQQGISGTIVIDNGMYYTRNDVKVLMVCRTSSIILSFASGKAANAQSESESVRSSLRDGWSAFAAPASANAG